MQKPVKIGRRIKMRFYQIRLTVYDYQANNCFSPQDIIGALDEETAKRAAYKEWNDCGYEVQEIFSCKEIFPKAVICERAIFSDI
jgi:hypothetical protein